MNCSRVLPGLPDLVEMMAARNLSIPYTTIMRWVHHYAPRVRAQGINSHLCERGSHRVGDVGQQACHDSLAAHRFCHNGGQIPFADRP